MNNQKIKTYFCLLPVFGSIPSVISLLRDRDGEVKDAAKVSMVLFLLWVSSFLALGGNASPETFTQIPGELVKGTLASGYFVGAVWLMYRVYRGQSVSLPQIKNKRKND